MQQLQGSLTFQKTLKTEDYLLISQQLKHYQELSKTLAEQAKMLQQKITQLQQQLRIANNKRQQYETRYKQMAMRLNQFEHLKFQLINQYGMIKQKIKNQQKVIECQKIEIKTLESKVYELESVNLQYEQKLKSNYFVMKQNKQHNHQLQKLLLQSKIKHFEDIIDNNKIFSKPTMHRLKIRNESFLRKDLNRTSLPD